MSFFTKFGGKKYKVDLNPAVSSFAPPDGSGKHSTTSSPTSGQYTSTGFYGGSSPIYTQLTYPISLVKNTNVNSVSLTYVNIDKVSTTTTTAGTYYGDPGSSYSWSATAVTGYSLNASSGAGHLNSGMNISPTASPNSYTITFSLGGSNYGAWSCSTFNSGTTKVTAYYGDTISRSGNVVTIYQGSSSTKRHTVTFTNGSATGYTYSVSYNSITTPISGAQTITATTSRSANSYKVTFALGGSNYGAWSCSTFDSGTTKVTVYYGDAISRSGNVVTVYQGSSSTIRHTVTFTNGSATGYTYNVSYNSITTPISGAQTITATTSRTVLTYTLYVAVGGTYINDWCGDITVTSNSRGTILSKTNRSPGSYDGPWTVTVNHFEQISFTAGTYSYSSGNGSGGTVTYSATAPSSITVPNNFDSNGTYTATYTASSRTCSVCNGFSTCGHSSSCSGCSAYSTCGTSSRGSSSCVAATCRRSGGNL